MILKALYDYYQRSNDLAPEGFEFKEIPFIICIDKEGRFVQFEDMRYEKNKCKTFQVLKTVSRSSAPITNVLWDNVEYVLNFTLQHLPPTKELTEKEENKRKSSIDKSAIKNKLFIEKIKELSARYPENKAFQSVLKFYTIDQWDKIRQDRLWAEIEKKPTVNLSFRVGNALEIVAEHDDLKTTVETLEGPSDRLEDRDFPICLITGEKSEPVLTSTATMIPGSQATAKLVSFQVKSGYDSFGNSQGLNAPVSKSAESAYTTALNHLLRKESPNKYYLGNRTFVFWASSDSEASQAAEQSLSNFMNIFDEEDDPNRRLEEVRKTLNALKSGLLKSHLNDRFYFLGLAPNSARIAVVYWNECSLKEFAAHLLKHFEDMSIIDTYKEKKPYCGVSQMLRSVVLKGKDENVPPNLQEALLKSILQDIPYPETLQQICVRRIRATQEVSITRAAILKACINRKIERTNNNQLKSINMGLDVENTDLGYLCGRLFATLEYAQEKSNNGKSTIRERYMNGVSATPSAVMHVLLNLSNHHMEKLNNGAKIFLENIKMEIFDKVPADGFPAHLDLQEQSRFFVGYYHQRQFFFTSRSDKELESENE